MINEDDLFSKLLKEKDSNQIIIKSIKIDIFPNYKTKDSPDFILRLQLSLTLLKHEYEMNINIPIELEKAGINEAILDLNKFVDRHRFKNKFPMIVISGSGNLSSIREYNLLTIFNVRQIPERSI